MVGGWLRSETKISGRTVHLNRGVKDQMRAVGISVAKAVNDGTLIIDHDTDPFPSENAYLWPEYRLSRT